MKDSEKYRRDFIKLAVNSLAALPLSRFNKLLAPGRAEATGGVDFDLHSAPNEPFITFAIDSTLVVNSVHAFQGQNFENAAVHGLMLKGYSSTIQDTSALQALQLLSSGDVSGWSQFLAAAGREMYGAPVRATKGRVVDFGIQFPRINQLAIGDTLITRSGLPGVEKKQEVIILAKANALGSEEPVVLGSYTSGYLRDGVTTQWLTQDELGKVAVGIHGTTQVIRSAEMYSLMAENTIRLREYETKIAGQISKGYFEDSQAAHVAESLSDVIAVGAVLPKSAQDRSIWIAGQLTNLRYITDAGAKFWVQNRDVYDTQAFGLSEAMLIQDVFPVGKFQGLFDQSEAFTDICHTSTDLFAFIADLDKRRLSVPNVIARPEKALIAKGLEWAIPRAMNDFAFGDSIFIANHEGLAKPEVGCISKAEIGPDSALVNIIFFNWKGSGMPKEFSFTSFSDITRALGGADIGIFRSEKVDEMIQIRAMRNHEILHSTEVPEDIKHRALAFHPDYRGIPQIRDLQNKLLTADTLKKRGEIIMQIAALMGVETRDGAELNQPGYLWNIKDPRDKCNIYSAGFVRAIGLDRYISHWVLHGGKPAFNTGKELSAQGMNAWMTGDGLSYGWFPVTRMSMDRRLDYLQEGYIMYGATSGNDGDTWVIYGVEGKNGNVLPVLSKASVNNMSTYPYRTYHFTHPLNYLYIHPEAAEDSDILWAHAGPGGI